MQNDQQPAITVRTLREALKFFLEDDNYVDRLEAGALQDLILRDGKVSVEERAFLRKAIEDTNFDAAALKILEALLAEEN